MPADVLSVVRNGAFLTGAQWSEAVLRAVFVIAIARLLGAEAYGIWNYAIGAYTLGVLCSIMGTDVLMARQVGRAPEEATPFIAAALGLRLVLLLASGVALALFALLAAEDSTLQLALLLTVPALFARGLALWSRPIFTGLERAGMVLRITGSIRLLELVVGLVILFATRDVLLVLGWHAVSWVLEALVSYRLVQRATGLRGPRFSRAQVMPVLRAGMPIGLAAMAVAALTTVPVLLAVPLGFDLQAVGQLGIAVQLGSLLTMAAQGFLNASLPVLSRRTDSEQTGTGSHGWLVVLATLLLFAPVCLLAWQFGGPLLALVLGEGYSRAAELLWLVLLVAGASVVPNGYWQLLVVAHRQRAGIFPSWAGLLLSLGLLVFTDLHQTLEGLLWAALAGWILRASLLVAASLRIREADQNPT
ncbi:oligosaccharide flippase family protein [Aurantiacibacter gilvus]|uniref:Oligosaccharide flippase family protein n=1 Tax=Aurantiacibacter gilvus TaxID=3139141 RepID=A0ABU9ICF5_9SPHN